MKLSIVIPCFNESGTIRQVVDSVRRCGVVDKEIIVVDDGSTDGTAEILREDLESKVDKVIFHQANQGKGAAIRTGIAAIGGDVMVIQDADLEYDPNELTFLLEPIVSGKADVVYGSRFVGDRPHRVLYFWHSVGNKLLTTMSNMFTNLNLTDMETCYKMFLVDVIRKIDIQEDGFGMEPEITAKVAKLGCRIYEVGISYSGRTYEEGKKIGWRDGVRAIYCILKYNVFR